mmetsp:Transcript_30910/g.43891  ORF Transcript_30910/g.43891 Transcript_30910/m.43891 type:complete len:101 (-) Transcript_30910:106-408(-)
MQIKTIEILPKFLSVVELGMGKFSAFPHVAVCGSRPPLPSGLMPVAESASPRQIPQPRKHEHLHCWQSSMRGISDLPAETLKLDLKCTKWLTLITYKLVA